MADDQVARNLAGIDELDFTGWNQADWNGVFARHHTSNVLVDIKGQKPTQGVQEHIDAMKAMTGGSPRRSRPTPSGSAPGTGRAWSESSRTVADPGKSIVPGTGQIAAPGVLDLRAVMLSIG